MGKKCVLVCMADPFVINDRRVPHEEPVNWVEESHRYSVPPAPRPSWFSSRLSNAKRASGIVRNYGQKYYPVAQNYARRAKNYAGTSAERFSPYVTAARNAGRSAVGAAGRWVAPPTNYRDVRAMGKYGATVVAPAVGLGTLGGLYARSKYRKAVPPPVVVPPAPPMPNRRLSSLSKGLLTAGGLGALGLGGYGGYRLATRRRRVSAPVSRRHSRGRRVRTRRSRRARRRSRR